MIEEPCPKCGGPALRQPGDRYSCSFCGDFVHGLAQQLPRGGSLLDTLPEPPPERKTLNLDFVEAEADSFPVETVTVRLPVGFLIGDIGFDETAALAIEFFFGFLEVYEAIPEVPVPGGGEVRELSLLSSHALRLSQLAPQTEHTKEWLCELALELYNQSQST